MVVVPGAAVVGKDPLTGGVRGIQVAELVAGELRRRILDAEIADGGVLPPIDELVEEFGSSRTTIREALRILETEGLATVRRGRNGGAVVHQPRAATAAHTLGIILRAQRVVVDDVAQAIRLLEPVCVSLCASRPDRTETLVPTLRHLVEQARNDVDDPAKFTAASSAFHSELVHGCGNRTLIIVLGALEVVWEAHARAWATARDQNEDEYPDDGYPGRLLDDHEMLLRLIERGHAEAAAREAERHLAWVESYVRDVLSIDPALLATES